MKKSGHTSNGYGTLLLERKIAGVNIRRASGTRNPEELAAIISLLEALARADRLDLVKQVGHGKLRAVDLLRMSQARQPLPVIVDADSETGTPDLATSIRNERRAMPLAEAVEAMMAVKPGRQSHLKEMRRQLLALAKRHEGRCVRDLEGVLMIEREAYLKKGHRAAFTRLRANSMVLAKWADGGGQGEIWTKISEGIDTTPIASDERRVHKPFSVRRAEQLRRDLNARRPGAGEIFMALCLTGMRPSEYFGKVWAVAHQHVFINGTKTKRAIRKIPLVAQVVQPMLEQRYWGKIFREVSQRFGRTETDTAKEPLKWSPYDCRRTFAQWCDASGVPRGRSAHYLGHAPTNITDHYAFRPPTMEEIKQDGDRLKAFISSAVQLEMKAIEAEGTRVRAHTAAHTPLVIDLENSWK